MSVEQARLHQLEARLAAVLDVLNRDADLEERQQAIRGLCQTARGPVPGGNIIARGGRDQMLPDYLRFFAEERQLPSGDNAFGLLEEIVEALIAVQPLIPDSSETKEWGNELMRWMIHLNDVRRIAIDLEANQLVERLDELSSILTRRVLEVVFNPESSDFGDKQPVILLALCFEGMERPLYLSAVLDFGEAMLEQFDQDQCFWIAELIKAVRGLLIQEGILQDPVLVERTEALRQELVKRSQ